MAFFTIHGGSTYDEHEKSLAVAPYATVLDGFVELGRFLGH